jgi:hypothetical protein
MKEIAPNLNYPVFDIEENLKILPEADQELYVFDDPVMKKIFGSHFVNVKLQSNNMILNILNDKSHISVCVDLKTEIIRFEMRYVLNFYFLKKNLIFK